MKQLAGAPRQAPASQRAGLASDPMRQPLQAWEMGIVFKRKNYSELTPLPRLFFCSQLSLSSALFLLFLLLSSLAKKSTQTWVQMHMQSLTSYVT